MIDAADAARLRVVRLFGPHARALLVPRDVRIAWTGTLLLTSAFVTVGLLPVWVLAAGPIVWGVPHVLADVRYLVVRPGYHTRLRVALPLVLALALGLSSRAGGLAGVLVGASLAALLARASLARRAVVAVPLAALAVAAHRAPELATLVFAHVHNAVALAFFVFWPSRARARAGLRERLVTLVPAVVAVLFASAILAGALDAVTVAPRGLGTATWDDLAAQLAPPLLCADPVIAARLTLLYAFGQSVHYVVWLRLVPEEERARPRSFRQALRGLTEDLGRPLLVVSAAVAVALGVWAVFDVGEARSRYLQIAFFHGWVELVAAAVMLTEARRRR
jgi:hypothetical protein